VKLGFVDAWMTDFNSTLQYGIGLKIAWGLLVGNNNALLVNLHIRYHSINRFHIHRWEIAGHIRGQESLEVCSLLASIETRTRGLVACALEP